MRIKNNSLKIVKSFISTVIILVIGLVISPYLSLVLQAKVGHEDALPSTSPNGDQGVSATPNNLNVMAAGCYYVSKVSHEGAGGKLFFLNPSTNLDILIASDYNKLGKNSPVFLGNFKVGDRLIFKINPLYSKSPKEIISTDSKRVKQTNNPVGSNNYQLAFEDAIDNDFNDIVLKVFKEKCEDEEEIVPPVIPPVDPSPTPAVITPVVPPLTPPTEPATPVAPSVLPTPTLPTPVPTSPAPVTSPISNPSNPPTAPLPNGDQGVSSTVPTINPTPTPNAGQGVSSTVDVIPSVAPTQSLMVKNVVNPVVPSPITASTPNGRMNPSPTVATQSPTTSTATPLAITGAPLYNECSYPDFPWDNWCVQYYNTNPYTGIMTYSENYYPSNDFLGRKDFINKDWGNGSPGGITPVDNFSAKFIKHQWFEGGFYKFYTQFDDGMKLVIDGKLIIDKWENPAWDFETRTDISRGWHTVEVYYLEKTGNAKISLSWELSCKDYINTTSWCGEFYPNNYYGGIPFKPVERKGDFWDDNWGTGNVTYELNNKRNLFSGTYVNQLSQLPTDNFTGYFTKLHYFPAATYTFITQADDNIQIFIDGENIISQLSCCNQTKVDKQLSAGNHLIQIRYKEFTGEAKLFFKWENADKTPPAGFITNPAPASNYLPVAGSSFTVTANAYDVGTIQTGISSVSFYAYYDNSLKFLGISYNNGGIPFYGATLDLTKLSKYNTGNQDVEFSIAVTDKAGNTTNVAGGSRWIVYSPANTIEQSFSVNDGNNNFTSANLRIENPNVTGNATNLKANYSTSGQNRNVWIVSHGMNNTRNNMTDLASSIVQNTKEVNGVEDIVLTLDWSGGATSTSAVPNPTDTDQWIEPTAIQVKKKLDQWGFTNRDKLYLIGHSMGTIMSAEISSQFGNQAKILIALDPPSNFTTGSGAFTTNNITGKQFNSFSGRAQRTVAYVGRGYLSGSFCGNYSFTVTANEAYQVYIPEQNDFTAVCPAHGSVVKSIASMFRDRRIQNGLLAINNTTAGTFPRTRFIDDIFPIDVNGMLYATKDSNIQYLAYLQNNRINLIGKTPRDTELTEYWLASFRSRMYNISNFSYNSERIGLFMKNASDYSYRYQIINVNNKPVIQNSYKVNSSSEYSYWIDYAEVGGGRAGSMLNSPNPLSISSNFVIYK